MSPRTQSDTKLVEPMQNGLEILSWSFWSPETRQPQDWPAVSPVVEPPAVLGAQIPPAHRRRMSTLSKMAVQVALEATAGARPDFVVFCSQHGELTRTRELLRSIVERVELSPASFSQSVHNTAAGLYTIVTASRAPATSLAAGAASFAYGWLEAEAFIAENRAQRVLLVSYDEPLPDEYLPYSDAEQRLYALAVVLGASTGGRAVELEIRSTTSSDDQRPLAPLFMAWFLGLRSTLEVTAGAQRWVFNKRGG
jgi:hypothetical protein